MPVVNSSVIPDTNSFRLMDADAYLFDIDGTLLVTKDLVHWNALSQAMLEVYGVDTSIEGIAYHGKTDLGILRAALARVGIVDGIFDSKLPAALEVICREVASNASGIDARVCPGIPEILDHFQHRGKLLGVASGNLASVGWQKLSAAGLCGYFSFGCFSDTYEQRGAIFRSAVDEVRQRMGPHARAVFVGDTPEDIKAAREAGAHIIAVATGIFGLEDLRKLDPDSCIASCAELIS